ncbi:MAG: peptide chain release factor 1 [Bdellovibrionales bacterium]
MFTKLDDVETRFEDIGRQLQDPSVTNDQKKYRQLMKDYNTLQKIVNVYRQYRKVSADISSNKDIIQNEKDEEFRTLAKEEMNGLEAEQARLAEELKILLIPKDPNDDKNIILEIRAGAGGDEASLFAEELCRAYSLFAAQKGWNTELMSASSGNAGGYKEVVVSISGDRVYSFLKYESGVHRVQRVPQTETQGRVHTSTVTVAVLPEADEVDIEINPADLRIDVYRASGAGGQHVNKTDSAVRITHIPSGIVVACQDERSQIKNRSKAMKILYARMLAFSEEKAIKEASVERLAQIGTGDRSERIRTYNFPQSRLTDHRIGLTVHQLNQIMNGDMGIVVEPLIAHFQAEALKAQV